MADIVERLREGARGTADGPFRMEAADEIERLRATVSATGAATMAYMKDIDRLRAALKRIAADDKLDRLYDAREIARAALAGTAETGEASPRYPHSDEPLMWFDRDRTAAPADDAPNITESNNRADAALASMDSEDAARFRWLCGDHNDRAARHLRDSLLERMSVMSLSAVRAVIDVNLKNPSEPSHKPGTCQQCGRYLDRRGRCRFPEHNA